MCGSLARKVVNMDANTIFWIGLGFIALLRFLELRKSRKNETWIISQGGYEVGHSHYKWMVLLHTTWFIAIACEIYFFSRPIILPLAIVAALAACTGMILRYLAISTLGNRWTTKIFILEGKEAVHEGIFRFLKHPNYLGVILEIFFVPLIHTAHLTSILFTILNGILLKKRIAMEEQALTQNNDYHRLMKNRPRLIPKWQKSEL